LAPTDAPRPCSRFGGPTIGTPARVFHAHVYFDPDHDEEARALRERIGAEFVPGKHVQLNGVDHLVDAAGSLREGIDETLTLMRLGLPPTLRKSLATTNPIECTFSTVRRVSRRVTRWQSGTMTLRWALAGTMGAEKTWRRLMGRPTCRSS
jgi:hypothetical protein